MCWLRQHASWRRLALRARRRWRGRSARPAPAASLISASRYALGARRTALRAEGAARRGRCAPVCRAAQPLAAIDGSRYALGADGVGAARPGACGSPVAASRCALGADGVGAARPGAYMLSPPRKRARVASWWWGCRRRRALRADRDACRKARFALLPRARMGRGVSGIIMHERAGQRLRASAACAVRVGAARHWNRSALPPGQADPPHFERACAASRRCSGRSSRHDDLNVMTMVTIL